MHQERWNSRDTNNSGSGDIFVKGSDARGELLDHDRPVTSTDMVNRGGHRGLCGAVAQERVHVDERRALYEQKTLIRQKKAKQIG